MPDSSALRAKRGNSLVALGRALGRVSTSYREAATWPGEGAFHVRVEMVGLERPESAMVLGAVLSHERVEHLAKHILDEELARERRSFIAVDVVRVANVATACTLMLDAVRAALVDTGLAGKVESLKVEGGGV